MHFFLSWAQVRESPHLSDHNCLSRTFLEKVASRAMATAVSSETLALPGAASGPLSWNLLGSQYVLSLGR